MAVVVSDAYLLVGSWMNCLVYMVEITLIIRYFQQSSRPQIHKLGVAAILAFDTAGTVAICAQVYTTPLVFPGEFDFVSIVATTTPVAVTILATYSTAAIEQLFLCSLYFTLTKHRHIGVGILLTIAVHTGCLFSSAILILKNHSPLGPALITSELGAIICAATDVIIASVLVYTLFRLERTSVVRASMHRLLRILMIRTVTSGVAVAFTTTMTMTLLLKNNTAYSLFFFMQGRVYALTIMFNFFVGPPSQAGPTTSTHLPGGNVTTVVFSNEFQNANDNGAAAQRSTGRRSEAIDIGLETMPGHDRKLRTDSDEQGDKSESS
ncbi:hypothetical protein C8F04DRAFT_1233802 [Mycena alexandri]|uniref:DUF6534 domain-containing protein n=1 Tax=Mycena alexandri TaxID=1745969 RepID=A0AAD6X4D5_9AGAR|nr:hypothetical protein C8F04DRAFT_1233802 [Mycena alexandri]